jgi:hypothetical protein
MQPNLNSHRKKIFSLAIESYKNIFVNTQQTTFIINLIQDVLS